MSLPDILARWPRKVVVIILYLLCIVFLISGLWNMYYSIKFGVKTTIPQGIAIIDISRQDYEVLEDGTVLIRCSYLLKNTQNYSQTICIGGIFTNEKSWSFMNENVLFADGLYTLEPGERTTFSVEFIGHQGSCGIMPNSPPPKPYIVTIECGPEVFEDEQPVFDDTAIY